MRLRSVWMLSGTWVLLVCGSLWANLVQLDASEIEIGNAAARSHFEKDILVRRWATGHGGVYVPPTTETPPNPYLADVPERDVVTQGDKALTLLNPAYMTRQIYELAGRQIGVRGHITSLKPLRPENAPDEWERQALLAFERGATEASERVEVDRQKYVRLMRPLVTEEGCLKCHRAQGYELGQIRGGISVTVPLAPYVGVFERQRTKLLLGHCLVGLLGLAGLWAGLRRLQRAEAGLRDSESLFHTMSDWTSDWEYWVGPNGRFRYVSPSVFDLTGYRADEVMQSPEIVAALVHEDDRALWQAQFDDAGEAGAAPPLRSHDFRIVRRDGSVRWVTQRSRPVIGIDGTALGRRVSVQDITERRQAEAALRERETHYRVIYEASQDFITINRLSDGIFLDINQPYLDALGYVREELIGHTPTELSIWANPNDRVRFIDMLKREGRCRNLEACFRARDGHFVWALASSSIVELDGVQCIYSVTRDISERKETEVALAESEKHFRALYQASQDFIFINRLSDGVFLEVNPLFIEASGYRADEIIGRAAIELDVWADLLDRQRFYDALRHEGKCHGLETRLRRKNGELVWWYLSASIVELNGEACIYSVARDITERKLAEARINELAFYDPLTRLPNRTLLLDRLRQALIGSSRSGQYGALLLIDLDNFKTLNDTLGHDTGDRLLQQVAQRLLRSVRAEDTVARFGGDEFVIILSGLSSIESDAATQVERIGEKIVAAFAQTFYLQDTACQSAPSIGANLFLGQQVDIDTVLKQADIAMYRAKDEGGNGLCFFDPAMESLVLKHAALAEDLREALRQQQFLLHFQAQVSGGRLSGAEVLVRWQHPDKGLVSPGEFIPLAEETGLIIPLGNWVLETACAQLAAWEDDPLLSSLTISVNVSFQQFRQDDFVDQVLTTLKRTRANPERLKLELTESMLASNVDALIERMYALKAKGVGFALDDFGTGYSSLAYLKRLPLDHLKIDQSFVRDVFIDSNDSAIVKTIVALAQSLGLNVIAEGVETEEQRDYLASVGCHACQGYFFSRPLPIDDFERFVRKFQKA
ncbi:EAL domain-containing protein [uncultured Propionivibrio sp.]|uniref:EAL domain-containing protein n=1 Tax=uncultured Propionivibrio sp. TaxID=426737 RepID=UPI0029BFFDCB|nr:EAL domain-containing protein [uncultured Propionivibrio sp.]